jgi:hypothetical protein
MDETRFLAYLIFRCGVVVCAATTAVLAFVLLPWPFRLPAVAMAAGLVWALRRAPRRQPARPVALAAAPPARRRELAAAVTSLSSEGS